MSVSNDILRETRKALVGKDQILRKVYTAILAGGHVLLEDVPGVGKTTLALAFSRAMSLHYSRVQFTPDVLPSDIVGFSMPDKSTGKMLYKPGAILCNLFLADELNRATSRTQSALLEAMEENQVTVDGVSHPLPDPFIVIATQNPTGAAGTQLLPDSQMDRFMIRLSIGYPDPRSETEMLRLHSADGASEPVKAVTDAAGLADIRPSGGERIHSGQHLRIHRRAGRRPPPQRLHPARRQSARVAGGRVDGARHGLDRGTRLCDSRGRYGRIHRLSGSPSAVHARGRGQAL